MEEVIMPNEEISAQTTQTEVTTPAPEVNKEQSPLTYEREVKQQQEAAESSKKDDADGSKKENKESNEVEFTDTSNKDEGTESKKEEKPKQTKEQNSKFAERRREEERKAEADKTRVATIIEVLNGKNPYTNEEMTDKEDVEVYLAMKEIEKQGGDPIKDYFKHSKQRRIAEEETKSKEQERKEWFANDKANFVAKHPEVNLNELVDNKEFALFAKGKVGNLPMTEIYEDYLGFVGKSTEKATDKAAQMLANSQATPGALKSSVETENNYFTREQVKNMSQKQVEENYDKIRESMKTWKN